MDFNDIDQRLERLYSSVSQQYDHDIEANIKEETLIRDDGIHELHISFGNDNKAEIENKILNVIHGIAGLKDHIKNKLSKTDRDPKSFEDLISDTKELSIVIDIDNMDKHGDPLTISNRSGLSPHLSNLQQALSPSSNQSKTSFAMRSTFNGGKPSAISEMSGDFRIVITGDVIDGNGLQVMSVPDLLMNSMSVIEEFIDENELLG